MAYNPAITYHGASKVFCDWLEASEPPLRWIVWLESSQIANLTERVSLSEDL